jgi:misacylated tRNA(Ala) deacylase
VVSGSPGQREGVTTTELLWQTDSYARAFAATVVDVSNGDVALDRSAFYPGGGGQPPDLGRLVADSASDVLALRRDGDILWHGLDGAPPPRGAAVIGEIDWERRYALMRTHTAMHILCGVIWRDYGAKVTGGNMQPLTGRMDFEFEQMRGELVREIEEKVNVEVEAARPISVYFLDRAEAERHPDLIRTKVNLLPEGITQVRIVDIDGLDVQADGGTHVARTDEVGPFRISGYKSKGRANKRIEIALSENLLDEPTRPDPPR